MWIDSHCHLNHEKFGENTPEKLVETARAGGVDSMLTISCRISDEFPDILKLAKQFDNVWCSVGTHPHDAGDEKEKSVTKDDLVNLAKSDAKIIGIGESGLDYYYNNSSKDDQIASFRKHIRACIETDLPLIIHARDADEDIAKILKEEGQGTNLKGVMHCFSSGPKLAEEALNMGFYISFSGILTFKKAQELQEIAANVPLHRLLVETDAPYLAPEPYRGKTNEPAYVVHTGQKLAELHNITAENMAKQTTDNFYRLFDKAQTV